jgi:hypothetical protein
MTELTPHWQCEAATLPLHRFSAYQAATATIRRYANAFWLPFLTATTLKQIPADPARR